MFVELEGQWRYLSGMYEKPIRTGLDYSSVISFLKLRVPKKHIQRTFDEIRCCERGALMGWADVSIGKLFENLP